MGSLTLSDSGVPEPICGLRHGDHLCWLYDNEHDFKMVIAQFVEQGLAANERIIYCTSFHQQSSLLQTLSLTISDVAEYLARGQLLLLTAKQWFHPQGTFLVDSAISRLATAVDQALADGYSGLRFTCEMSWALDGAPGSQDLIEYEARINSCVRDLPCIAMCQYNQKHFEITTLLDVVATHPIIALGRRVYENLYHIPPQDFLGRPRPAAALFNSLRTLQPLRGAGRDGRGGDELVHSLHSLLMLESILGSMTEGIVVSDEHANIVLINRAGRELLGLDAGGRLPQGDPTWGYFVDEGSTRLDAEAFPLLRALRGEEITECPLYVRTPAHANGLWISVNARQLSDRFSGVKGGILVVRDLSAQKRAEEEQRRFEQQLNQAQKLESLGVLAGGIAHDFNNMLAGIMGNAGLLLMQVTADSPFRSKLEAIRAAAQRASELTSQLLTYSGKGTFQLQPLCISGLISEMEGLIAAAVSKKASLKLELSEDLLAVEADASQVRQVLLNLVTNASEALEDLPGQITIRTGCINADRDYLAGAYVAAELNEGTYAYVEVEDTGKGMDASTQARIFDPFFTTKFVGRGLGLAAVLGIVRRHRGALILHSRPYRGTLFRVLFPALTAPAAERAATLVVPRNRGTALVVDDEEGVRMVVADMLEAFGFSVMTAANGTEAVRIFREHASRIDLVLLDVTMPDINGDQACREIKQIRSDAPVILMSGYSEVDASFQFAESGSSGFLQKPYGPEALLQKVNEIVGSE